MQQNVDRVKSGAMLDYTHLDPDTGCIRVGVEVRPNDVLVGKVKQVKEGNAVDVSVPVPFGVYGTVEAVEYRKLEHDAKYKAIILIRVVRKTKLNIGDKCAIRGGQKFTVCEIRPEAVRARAMVPI